MGRSFKRNDPLYTEKHTVAFKGTCFFIFGCVEFNIIMFIFIVLYLRSRHYFNASITCGIIVQMVFSF